MKALEDSLVKIDSYTRSRIDPELQRQLISLTGDAGIPVLEELVISLEEKRPIVPPLRTHLTESGDDPLRYGDLVFSGRSYRPDTEISYDAIDDMMRSAQVVFALAIKQAAIRSVLRNERSWKADCEDQRMAEVVRGIMQRLFRRHSHEFMTYIPYGSAFFEKEWSYQPAQHWGITGASGKFYGLDLYAIHPRSIDRIEYRKNGRKFNGFVQNRTNGGELSIKPENSLILTHGKLWRNLWGTPAMDIIYPYWFWLEVCMRAFMRYLERTGTPVAIVYAPMQGKITGSDGNEYDSMAYAMLQASYIAKSNAAAFPSDVDPETGKKLWEVSYLTDTNRGDQFIIAIERLSTMMTRGLVIGDRTASQEGAVGSFAMSQVHYNVTQQHNEWLLDELLRQINDYVVEQIVRYNGSVRTPPAMIETEGLDPEEKNRLFNLLNTMGNQAGGEALKQIDWEAICSINNIPTLTQEQVDELYERELERTKERNEALAATAGPQGTPPGGKKPEGPKKSVAQETVQNSVEWMQYQLEQGAMVPAIISREMAEQIEDYGVARPFVVSLFNPYRDELGRFASKPGGAGVFSSGKLGGFFFKIGDIAKGVYLAPAEYLTRKDGLGPKLARAGIEIGSDILINRAVKALLFAKASVVGAAGTAVISGMLFGAAFPPAALALGGIAFGIGATLVVSELLDWGQSEVFHAYLKHAAPQDGDHIQFSGYKGLKGTVKAARFADALMPDGDINTVIRAFGMLQNLPPELAAFLAVGQKAVGVIGGVPLEQSGQSEGGDFAIMLLPHVLSVITEESVARVSFPRLPQLEVFPGVSGDGDVLYIDYDGAVEFAEAFASGDFPKIGPVEFGDVSWGLDPDFDQEKITQEQIALANPYHDKLGRFTTKPGGGSGLYAITKDSVGAGDIKLSEGEVETLKKSVDKIKSSVNDESSGSFDIDVEPTHSIKEFSQRGHVPRIAAKAVMGIAGKGGKVFLNPRVVESLAGRDVGMKSIFSSMSASDTRKFAEHTIAHEMFHTRKRKHDIPFDANDHVDIREYNLYAEEAATEILSSIASKRMGSYTRADMIRLAAYGEYTVRLAKEARTRYPDSKADALKWVSKLHRTGATIEAMQEATGGRWYAIESEFSDLSGGTGKFSGNGVNEFFYVTGTVEDLKWLYSAPDSVKLELPVLKLESMSELDIESMVKRFVDRQNPADLIEFQEIVERMTNEEKSVLERVMTEMGASDQDEYTESVQVPEPGPDAQS